MLDEIIKGLEEAARLTEEALSRVRTPAEKDSERGNNAPDVETRDSVNTESDNRAEAIYADLVDNGLVDERALRTPVEIEVDAVAEDKVSEILSNVGHAAVSVETPDEE